MATKPEIPFLILISGRLRGRSLCTLVYWCVCVGVCCESAFNLCTGGQHFRHSHRIDMERRLASTAKVLWHFGLQSVQSIHPSNCRAVQLSSCPFNYLALYFACRGKWVVGVVHSNAYIHSNHSFRFDILLCHSEFH